MYPSKWFLKSKTIIGIILAALPALAVALGINFTEDDSVMISGLMDLIVQLVGSGYAIYGRFVAEDKISLER